MRKRLRRNKAAEVEFREPANPARRAACLSDPQRFMRTYGKHIFFRPFVTHHEAMIQAIWERAKTGGDKAIAAPRGEGKTQIALWMLKYILLANLVQFPVIVAATRKLAQRSFKQIKAAFASNTLLIADFPEICDCVIELDGAPQRAAKQHVDGVKTNIIWTQDEIGFPTYPGSPYGNKYMTYFGLDAAIRGVSFNGTRPDFVLIDDPETAQAARSDTLHYDIEEMIDGDIALLSGPDRTMTRVVLTTIQNRRCYSFRVTDRTIKPAFAGDRYGALQQWPSNSDLWQEYIAIRKQAQEAGDKDGVAAREFYIANQAAMQEGAILTNPYRFVTTLDAQGNAIEVDALQSFFNRVADLGMATVNAELQNNPDDEEQVDSLRLTPGRVSSRISGLQRNELPSVDNPVITAAIDVGKYFSYWVKLCFVGNATGYVIDYGVMNTPGMNATTSDRAVELGILAALLQWRTEILAVNPPSLVLVDSGDFSPAVYEFVRQSQQPFTASKGYDQSQFHMGKETSERRHFTECWAGILKNERQWLYHVNSEYWKQWVHERFNTPTFDETHQPNDGALSLFIPPDQKYHLDFSHQVCAEERQEVFIPKKGLQRKWIRVKKANHYLDAMAYASAAAAVMGVKIIQPVKLPTTVREQTPSPRQFHNPQERFRRRAGGWIPKRR